MDEPGRLTFRINEPTEPGHPLYSSAIGIVLFILFMLCWWGALYMRKVLATNIEKTTLAEKYIPEFHDPGLREIEIHSRMECASMNSWCLHFVKWKANRRFPFPYLQQDAQQFGICRLDWSRHQFAVWFLVFWIGIGVFVYFWLQPYTWAQSFFYSVESGLSIGYGALPVSVMMRVCVVRLEL